MHDILSVANHTFEDIRRISSFITRGKVCLISDFFFYFATVNEQVYIINFFKLYVTRNIETSMREKEKLVTIHEKACSETLQLAWSLLGQEMFMIGYENNPKMKGNVFAVLSNSFLVETESGLLEFEPNYCPGYWNCMDIYHSHIFRCMEVDWYIHKHDLLLMKETYDFLENAGVAVNFLPRLEREFSPRVSRMERMEIHKRKLTNLKYFLHLLDDSGLFPYFRMTPLAKVHVGFCNEHFRLNGVPCCENDVVLKMNKNTLYTECGKQMWRPA